MELFKAAADVTPSPNDCNTTTSPSMTVSLAPQNHRRRADPSEKRHACPECGLLFMTKVSMTVHRRRHTGDQPYQCDQCCKRFLHKTQLQVHQRSHTGETPFQCAHCPKAFRHRESLVTHVTTHTGVKPYQCQCCDGRFSCVGNLQKHRRCRPDTCGQPQYAGRNVKCAPRPSGRLPPAPVEEVLPPLLDAELIAAMADADDVDDDATFDMTVEYLEDEDDADDLPALEELVEIKFDLPVDSTSANAPECTSLEIVPCAPEEVRDDTGDAVADADVALPTSPGQPASVDVLLATLHARPARQSARLGTAPRVYALHCDRCPRRFTSAAMLRQHTLADCGRRPPHACDRCAKRFHSAGALRVHRTVHTDERPFRCEHCDQAFRTKHQVQVHTRRHTGERPYGCDRCEKRFAHRESALTHRAVHDGNDAKRFWCVQCGERFSCIRNLKAHRAARRQTCGLAPMVTRPLMEAGDGGEADDGCIDVHIDVDIDSSQVG